MEKGAEENQTAYRKLDCLKKYLQELGSIAVAFSGGVDSTFLLKVAHDVLGEQAIAITAISDSFPKRERGESEAFCIQEQIVQVICPFQELEVEGFCQNPRNRCYLCKKALFKKILEIAKERQIAWVTEGSNLDDLGDYRPGLQAIEELEIKSPLREVGLTKNEIRYLSRELKLPTWDKPSFACLSTRFVYGERITREKLMMVDRAEQLLLDKGFHQVRVRIHGTMARIEVFPEEFMKLLDPEVRMEVIEKFTQYGFSYVSMDLKGYRTGSMNET